MPVFIFTVHRGATLIGAFEPSGRMVGFAYAVVGMKAGKPMLWSHMTGVLPEYRGGLGYRLKLAQRERALAQGYDLIEWTFDPMQAMNAHFNFAKLGGVVEEYAVNFYGESTSALHRGTPTDRVVLSWQHRRAARRAAARAGAALRARVARGAEAPIVNTTVMDGEWRKTTTIDLTLKDAADLDRDPDRLHRDAAAGARARAGVAPGRAPDVRGVFREGLSRGGFRAAAGSRFRTVSAGPRVIGLQARHAPYAPWHLSISLAARS